MYPHQIERLTQALEHDGFEALVATRPANVFYVSGFRSLSRAVDPTTELFAVFAPRGVALVVPAIDGPAVAVESASVDHVVCYGAFVYEVGDGRDEGARRVGAWLQRRVVIGGGGKVVEPYDYLVFATASGSARPGRARRRVAGWPRTSRRSRC